MNWYEEAEDELCEQLNNGEITTEEFNKEMSELRREVRAEAEEAAEQARNDYYN